MSALAAPKLVEPKSRRKPVTKPVEVAKPNDHLKVYANVGVGIMAVLSALLNGYANATHAEVVWAGWAMGLAIPVIILILSKVASLLWKRGEKQAAKITAGVGIGLLFLSVWHCAVSISALTGSPFILAMPMAIAIDCGFVCCEWAAIQD
jgi:Na+/proline symporter